MYGITHHTSDTLPVQNRLLDVVLQPPGPAAMLAAHRPLRPTRRMGYALVRCGPALPQAPESAGPRVMEYDARLVRARRNPEQPVPVAQWIERRPAEPEIGGSSPLGHATSSSDAQPVARARYLAFLSHNAHAARCHVSRAGAIRARHPHRIRNATQRGIFLALRFGGTCELPARHRLVPSPHHWRPNRPGESGL